MHHFSRHQEPVEKEEVPLRCVFHLQEHVLVDLITFQPEKKFIKTRGIAALINNDPFLPFLATMLVGEDLETVDEELLTELERYDLSQLKLVAVMDLAGKWVAQVETPDGMGHTVYVGTPIGSKRGKVVSIKDGKVSVEEKYRDILGDIKTEIDELVIEHPEGGLGL